MLSSLLNYFVRKKVSKIMNFSNGKDILNQPTPNTPTLNTSFLKQNSKNVRLLYIHIPFCKELCPYCSFHRVRFNENIALRYFDALNTEILMYKKYGFNFNSVYVGGGTPTIMIEQLEKTLNLAKELFDIKEISVETNPDGINEKNLKILTALGVTRLSIGIQTFDNKILKEIKRDRYGSGEEIRARIDLTKGKFKTVNVDMIFNFPEQTEESLNNDLKILLEVMPSQITYYPLMPSSQTQEKILENLGKIDYKKEKKFYNIIVDKIKQKYNFSTVWCFSKKENTYSKEIDEYIINYDMYAGVGSGAIGYINGMTYANTFDIEKYIILTKSSQFPIETYKYFTIREQILNDFLMKMFGLKINSREIEQKYKRNKFELYWNAPEIFLFLLIGAIKKKGDYFYLTDKGRYYWLMMMREFFIGVNNFREYCRKKAKIKI